MTSSAIVEDLDVLKRIGSRLLPCCVAGAVYALVLQAVKETLGRCIDAPIHGNRPQGIVGGSVAAAIQAMSGCFARRCL